MTSRRSKQRIQRRDQHLRTALVAGAAVILVSAVACNAPPTPTPAAPAAGAPRSGHKSAAGLKPGDGVDICDQFPARTGAETQPPPLVIKPANDYAAWITMPKGVIVIDLYASDAPQTVNNFMFLACTQFYDGLTFHRVLPGFVAQGGDPLGDGTGGPGYTIPDEFRLSDRTFDRPGLLSMAHTSQPDSAGSQFFITYAPTPNLNGSFTIFGEVVAGMDVVSGITPRDPQTNPAQPGDAMLSVVVRQLGP